MFHVLQRSAKFLTEDVTDWPQSAAYQTSTGNVQAVNVINDSAERERRVKGERNYQIILQVVEKDCREQPILRNRSARPLNIKH